MVQDMKRFCSHHPSRIEYSSVTSHILFLPFLYEVDEIKNSHWILVQRLLRKTYIGSSDSDEDQCFLTMTLCTLARDLDGKATTSILES